MPCYHGYELHLSFACYKYFVITSDPSQCKGKGQTLQTTGSAYFWPRPSAYTCATHSSRTCSELCALPGQFSPSITSPAQTVHISLLLHLYLFHLACWSSWLTCKTRSSWPGSRDYVDSSPSKPRMPAEGGRALRMESRSSPTKGDGTARIRIQTIHISRMDMLLV